MARKSPAAAACRAIILGGVLALTAVAAAACAEDKLPALGADLSRTSVSGLSSGAYMAGQFQIAHADIVIGAGIVAGGPYGCAQSIAAETVPIWATAVTYNVAQALNGCMADKLQAFGVLNVRTLARRAERLAQGGEIDPVSEVADDRVYLFSGRRDETVVSSVVEAARDFYLALGVPRENIAYHDDKPAGHAFLTPDSGTACGLSEPPYVSDCDYDQARSILSHIYGELKPEGQADEASYVRFSQRAHGAGRDASMDAHGFAYIPQVCREQAGCAVHVAFHGCRQGVSEVGDAFIKGSGFARWAETNRLIVLFPQVAPSTLNPRGCWDWWGYTGLDFLTQDAPQIKAVYGMLQALAEPKPR